MVKLLRKSDYLYYARYHLSILREGKTDCYEIHLSELHKQAEKAWYSLKRLGTDESELRKLLILNCKYSAECCYKKLYSGATFNPKSCLENLRKHLKTGGLTLKDIGRNEAELNQIMLELYKKMALYHFKKACEKDEFFKLNLGSVRSYLSYGNLTPKEAGIREGDLKRLELGGYLADVSLHSKNE